MGAEPTVLIAQTTGRVAADHARAYQNLRELGTLLKNGAFDGHEPDVAAEVELSCYDKGGNPHAVGAAVLAKVPNDIPATAELMAYNLELNVRPRLLSGNDAFSGLGHDIAAHLLTLDGIATRFGSRIGLLGIAPTTTREHTTTGWMTRSLRFRAINNGVMARNEGRILQHITGPWGDTLDYLAKEITAEGALNSAQIHLLVNPSDYANIHNGAQLGAGPCLAASAGSPFFDGYHLWDETRIPLFEAALAGRAFFGDRWVTSALELFQDSVDHFAPLVLEEPNDLWLRTLRLRHGTVWRWNRPCVFEAGGRYTLTEEHRARPTGPTWRDIAADAAFTVGTTLYSRKLMAKGLASRLDFSVARDNFYAAALSSLRSRLIWPCGRSTREYAGRDLVLALLEPVAKTLADYGVADPEIKLQLGIVEQRVRKHNAAEWLRQAIFNLGPQKATLLYLENSQGGQGDPVGTWEPVL